MTDGIYEYNNAYAKTSTTHSDNLQTFPFQAP